MIFLTLSSLFVPQPSPSCNAYKIFLTSYKGCCNSVSHSDILNFFIKIITSIDFQNIHYITFSINFICHLIMRNDKKYVKKKGKRVTPTWLISVDIAGVHRWRRKKITYWGFQPALKRKTFLLFNIFFIIFTFPGFPFILI